MSPSRYKLTAFVFVLVTLSACSSASTGPTASPSTAAPTTGTIAAPTTGGSSAATPPIAQAPTLAPNSAPTTNAEGVSIILGAGRDGSQPGTAVLTPQGDKTQVVINIQPGPSGVPQPAHIHVGTCPGVGAVKYPLTNVVDGKSTTIVDDTLQDLLKGGYALNVHKSVSEIGIFVACGNISSASSNAVPSTTPGLGPASVTTTP